MKHSAVSRQFAQYVSCNVLGMIGLSCYILADTFFVSKAMGSLGLAALNFAIPLYSLINATGLMLGVGGATQYTLVRSKEGIRHANAIFTNLVLTALSIGLLIFLLGLFAAPTLATWLGANGNALSMTTSYLRILMRFAPAFLLNQTTLAFVRNDGSPHIAMAAMLTGSFVNVILDYVFMFPMKMGISGAAIATGFSPLFSLFVLSIHFFRKQHTLKLVRCRILFRQIGRSITLGLSSWITEVASGAVLLVFNLIILRITGNLGVAAYGIIANIALVAVAIFTGIAQGIQPLVSRFYSTGEADSLKKVRNAANLLALFLAAAFYAVIFLFSDQVIAVFNSEHNTALIPLAREGLRLYFVGFFFAGINIVMTAYLSAVELPKQGMFLSLLRGAILLVPLVLILPQFLEMTGVWLSFPLCELLTAGMLALLLRRSRTA